MSEITTELLKAIEIRSKDGGFLYERDQMALKVMSGRDIVTQLNTLIPPRRANSSERDKRVGYWRTLPLLAGDLGARAIVAYYEGDGSDAYAPMGCLNVHVMGSQSSHGSRCGLEVSKLYQVGVTVRVSDTTSLDYVCTGKVPGIDTLSSLQSVYEPFGLSVKADGSMLRGELLAGAAGIMLNTLNLDGIWQYGGCAELAKANT